MHDEKRFVQIGDAVFQSVSSGVIDKLLANREGAVGECHFGDPVRSISSSVRIEVLQYVSDIRGCRNSDHCRRLRDAMRSSENGGTAERVPDEQRGSREVLAQVVGSAHEVVNVGGEIGVLELSFR